MPLPQLTVLHVPQSVQQISGLSLASHTWSPQMQLQSPGQLAQFSSESHTPSPQHAPQSMGHVAQLSAGSQRPSPHEHAQSAGQVVQLSPLSHLPLPQDSDDTQVAWPLPAGISSQFWPKPHCLPAHTHASDIRILPVTPSGMGRSRLEMIGGALTAPAVTWKLALAWPAGTR